MKNKNLILTFLFCITLSITSLIVPHKKILRWHIGTFQATASNKMDDDDNTSSLPDSSKLNRRKLFSNVHKYGSMLPFLLTSSKQAKAAVDLQPMKHDIMPVSSKKMPLLDVPMRRLRLPEGAFGRDYVIIELMVKDKGPFEFMLDSGLSIEMITPHLQSLLGISRGNDFIKGISATGRKASNEK